MIDKFYTFSKGYGREITNSPTASFSRFFTYSQDEFFELINKCNGAVDVYSSVYAHPKHKDYDNCFIDRIFFDIDAQYCDSIYDEAKKLADFCKAWSVKRLFLLSGNGIQCYLYTTQPSKREDKRTVLMKATKNIIDKLDLNVDPHPVGDIARVARVIWTMNMKGNRYCQPVTANDIWKGEEHLQKISNSKSYYPVIIEGFREIPLDSITGRVTRRKSCIDVAGSIFDSSISDLPPCVKDALTLPNPSHMSRFTLVTHLSDLASLGNIDALDIDDKDRIIDEITGFISANTMWDDWNEDITRKQVKQIVYKGYRTRCERRRKYGLCKEKECEI